MFGSRLGFAAGFWCVVRLPLGRAGWSEVDLRFRGRKDRDVACEVDTLDFAAAKARGDCCKYWNTRITRQGTNWKEYSAFLHHTRVGWTAAEQGCTVQEQLVLSRRAL